MTVISTWQAMTVLSTRWAVTVILTEMIVPETNLGDNDSDTSCTDSKDWVPDAVPVKLAAQLCVLTTVSENYTYLASRKRDLRIMTASQVLCFNCISIAENFLRMIPTILSISLGCIGLVRLCSLNRLTTWVVNSLQAWRWAYGRR